MITFAVFLIFAYLAGSVSSAVIVSRIMGFADPRSEGSGNPGATNVLRVAGKHAAAIVLLCDFLKGFLPVMIGALFHLTPMALGWVALIAIVGHIFPVFFQFKGGKGIATAGGAIMAFSWHLGLVLLIIWIIIAAISRFSSLASLSSCAAAPVLTMWIGSPDFVLPAAIIMLLVFWRHQGNINRLMEGTESKISFGK